MKRKPTDKMTTAELMAAGHTDLASHLRQRRDRTIACKARNRLPKETSKRFKNKYMKP